MSLRVLTFVLLLACFATIAIADDRYASLFEAFPYADKPGLIKALSKLPLDYQEIELTEPFAPKPLNCPSIPTAPVTTNVNTLRPGNIRVVAAMGDSITVGKSALDTNVILPLREYPGISYSVGGATNVNNTIPNFLRFFTPTLYGGSVSTSNIGLNVAKSGAIIQDLPAQADLLVSRINLQSTLKNEWKVVTIWMGSNNLCRVCNDDANNNVAVYKANLTLAVQRLFNGLTNVFINLVSPLDVVTLGKFSGPVCALIHEYACPCVTGPKSPIASLAAVAYQNAGYEVATAFRNKRNDFAVVVQPFLEKTVVTDRNELSAADCFHPSGFGHAVGATALWNNMISPQSSKKRSWDSTESPLCPTANTYLATN